MKNIVILVLFLHFTIGLFAQVKMDNVVTVDLQDSLLVATFVIPEGMHQILQKDYFYLDADSLANVIIDSTIYPKGHIDKYGYINYEGTVKLTRKFTLLGDVKPEDVVFNIYTGYQLCFPTYCEAPVDLETVLPIVKKSNGQHSNHKLEK